MSDPQWKTLWEIFEAAVDLTPEAREAYLSSVCGTDEQLRTRVDDLIAKDAYAIGPLDRRIDESGLLAEASDKRPNRIGPYHIVRELGRGGMGQVYLGVRDDPDFRQEVAIKLIPLGRYSDQVLKRFVIERQILSDLNHENIARLLDGGVSDEGIPFLIMEYIDGLNVDDYCGHHELGLTARLELFEQVCHAVHYAHKQLIVHRDIKPGNVLVDNDGHIKLLDFGIAKLLDPQLAANSPVTATAGQMVTPEYASPEQLKGERLSTATDIYSLGVLLYQLLTGKRPIQIERSDIQSTVRAITGERPIRPSLVTQNAAGAGSAPVGPTSRQLKGDLDNIVMKALRKNPERRYGSAAQFAQDIRRHLDGFPVQARPESVAYRASKFVRRHPIGVAISVLISAILIGLTTTSVLQARRLEAALDEATVAQEKATQVADFLRGLFQANDPLAKDRENRTTQALLADGAERIRVDLSDQPEVQASLMKTMADVYLNMSMFEEAERLARDALEIYETLDSSRPSETLAGRLSLSRILYMQERPDESLVVCQQIIELIDQDELALPILMARAQVQCASSLTQLGRYEESIEMGQRGLALSLEHSGAQNDSVAQARRTLGVNYWFIAQFDQAREQFELAHRTLVAQYGEHHPRSIALLEEIASVELRSGELERAERIYRQTLSQRVELLGREHNSTANSYNHLGVTLLRQGKYAEAESVLNETVAIFQGLDGPDSEAATRPLANLALLYTETQRYDEALATHETLLNHDLATKEAGFWRIGLHLNNMGLVFQDIRDLARAEESFRGAREVIRKAWGEDHPGLAYSVNNLAVVLHDQGEDTEAESLFGRALELRRQGLDETHPALAATLHEYGRFLIDLGRLEDARPMIDQALQIRTQKLEADDWRTQHTLALSGAILVGDGRFELAEDVLVPALGALEEGLGEHHWRTRDTRKRVRELYHNWGKSELAAQYSSQ